MEIATVGTTILTDVQRYDLRAARWLGNAPRARLDRSPGRLYIPDAPRAQVAQSVEQRTENPRVGGSIPPLGTRLSITEALMALDWCRGMSRHGMRRFSPSARARYSDVPDHARTRSVVGLEASGWRPVHCGQSL